MIQEHNSNPERTYDLGITPFSFYSDEERNKLLGIRLDGTEENNPPIIEEELLNSERIENKKIEEL